MYVTEVAKWRVKMALEKIILGYKMQDMHFLERRLPRIGERERKEESVSWKGKRENDGREEKMRLESLK